MSEVLPIKYSKQLTLERKDVVYEVNCQCGKKYIGETGRKINKRFHEHFNDIVREDVNIRL